LNVPPTKPEAATLKRRSWKKIALIGLLALIAFLAGLALSIAAYGPQRVMSTPIGQAVSEKLMPIFSENDRVNIALDADEPMTKFYLFDFNGNLVDLPGKGKLRLINYWASWCGPCIEEMPMLDSFAKKNSDVMVIGIALEPYQDAKTFADKMNLSFSLFAETPSIGDSSALLGNGTGTLPYSVLIDGEGYVLAKKTGPFASESDIAEWVQDAQ
jgi:thiol-disulfide isomerase/thioredoxin